MTLIRNKKDNLFNSKSINIMQKYFLFIIGFVLLFVGALMCLENIEGDSIALTLALLSLAAGVILFFIKKRQNTM